MANKLNSSSLTIFVDSGLSLFILRVFAAGVLLYSHGYGKILNVLSGNLQFADPIGIGPELSFILAAFAEGICTIFVIIGFYTRMFALFLIINFLVAYFFMFKELALLYLVFFIVIFLLGPGKFSLDSNR